MASSGNISIVFFAVWARPEQHVEPTRHDRAEQVIPDVTDAPAWPTLRANLIALAAETGEHPLVHLYEAALGRDLSTAEDMAAVLNWRLPEPTSTHSRPPLPWLAGIPKRSTITPTGGNT